MKTNSTSRGTILVILLGIVFLNTGCQIHRFKNIAYSPANPALHTEEQQLNIFAPRNLGQLADVLIFIHGGNWNSGKKSLYNFFGTRFSRKGLVVVIIDYPLSPKSNVFEMARSTARSVQWVKNNIEKYGGNPDKIFISGHSAGGHLAALAAIRSEYFDSLGMSNPIKGAILIDAGGLDLYGYLQEMHLGKDHTYMRTFSTHPATWKSISPLYHLHEGMPPLLIYRGGKTYPSIVKSNEKFVKALAAYEKPRYQVLKNKKHIPMITQFFNAGNPLYAEMIKFMKEGR